MNEISSRTETKTETQVIESDDGHGNIVETETTVTHTYLYIIVTHKTAWEMADQYGFDEEQREMLTELLADEIIPYGRRCCMASQAATEKSCPLPCRRSAMWAVSLIGHGTVLEAGWNGAPALYLGVPMKAVISTPA